MKKLAGILLLSAYLLSFAEFHQLLQVPYLVQHFKQHKQADPDMSFVQFIRLHYFQPLPETDDFQHHQLPFKDMDCHMVSTAICAWEPVPFIIDPPAPVAIEYAFFDEVNKTQFAEFDIFQPPRKA